MASHEYHWRRAKAEREHAKKILGNREDIPTVEQFYEHFVEMEHIKESADLQTLQTMLRVEDKRVMTYDPISIPIKKINDHIAKAQDEEIEFSNKSAQSG